MTTKSQSPSSLSRLSRFGVSFKSSASSPKSRNRNPEKPAAEDNWYIPYNGPFEAPRQPYAKPKERDSWGDSLYVDEKDEQVSQDGRHGSQRIAQTGWGDKGRPRAHTESAITSKSGSSTFADASHHGLRNRNGRHPAPSYVNVGGVGESPVPRIRYESTSKSPFASIFSFSSSKKRASPPASISTKSDSNNRNRRGTRTRDDEDYYNSYYSTLVQSPLRNQDEPRDFRVEDPPRSPNSRIGRSENTHSTVSGQSSPTPHPYAYVFPTGNYSDVLKTAPLVSTDSRESDPFQRIPMRPSQSTGNGQHSLLHPSSAAGRRLTNSISSPDLRLSPASSSSQRQPKSSILKGKDRWLSPETWCDALFLPKPRFKVKQDGSVEYGKGRIVSPPGSPVFASFGQANQPPGVLSRVLAQSRSMVDLSRTADPSHRHAPQPFYIAHTQPSGSVNAEAGPSRPPRPRSLSLDDLALPSPVPSLARVLEEGQILEHQRKKWQMQAQGSFQNSRARNLSRARTKSLNSKQAKRAEVKHPHIDFLAARSLLGNQDPINISTKARPRTKSQPEGSGGATFSRSSHAHSNSLSKTSKSSKSHSQGHSRNDSWGRKVAKTTGGALCGFDASALTPTEEKKLPFDDVLAAEGTRVIRFEDPSTIRDSVLRLTPPQGPSPTPSAGTDLRMGIALSTPPMDIEDRESIRLPTHPYAQGGRYTYTSSPSRGSEFAGPHPSSVVGGDREHLDVSQRHRLPPRALNHPYAQYADHDSYTGSDRIVPNPRPDSNVSPASKMWARLSPNGVVQEILPEEIRYSPFVHAKGSGSNIRHSGNIIDTIGVGEALFNAGEVRGSKDSGLGASEEQGVRVQVDEKPHPYSNYRRPVEYDVTRPLYFHRPEKPLPSRPEEDTIVVTPTPTITPQRLAPAHGLSPSTDRTPETNSSQASPRPLGSPDDLEHFQDLFYRPGQTIGPALSRNPSSRSGLTTLANQLNQEFGKRERHVSGSSSSGFSRPSGDGMQFVLSERPDGASAARRGSIIPPFHPSVTIPEDVESSRASSVVERSPVEAASDEAFKLGQVESQATPPTMSSVHRSSFTGLMSFTPGRNPPPPEEEEDQDNTVTIRNSRALLHPSSSGLPSSDLTRSSYLTNSSLYSRISNLSDFPVPPTQDMPARMSYTSSYFDDQYTARDARSVTSSRRMTFGGDEEIDQLLASLSTN
ncbi:uncharacterized protein BT62DRAFT_929891 [Guyanagaster necrorhizus]|uniref:Uncharacterized protein n=1 Tax=Guyanagaster necrorhizus TaxID=856835 RepID=A0A9P7VXN2_9AGAR|nr:uncharacterized protein BT62DRAFT_929891 [Guyanagaster necrorhizus MCA 3950]KAG7448817.1 hypothetical protein BT62DRAFT_929891 [Guyanagaster necrorhizus MCA 3950]